ncbi:MAG: cytochrome P450 [Rhodococcus sp. (in: high G+C Gram-positive bacteria)]|uniref:cytochrome P450 n=1 Tax=Rhodococcus sp. TaxID=1831 RepID=UPI003BB0D80D
MTEVQFDHHSEAYARNWRDINRDLRAKCPVAHTAAHDGFWVVSKYDDIADIARDDDTFSSYQEYADGSKVGATIPVGPLRQVPIEMDPPEFFDYRKLLNERFTPAAVKKWEPYLREITTFCIDRVIESGSCDFVKDLTSPVPAIFTLQLLGLPKDDWQKFSDVTHSLVHAVPGTPESDAAMAGMFEIVGQVTTVMAERRAEPTDDLISLIVNAEINGEPLTEERIIQMITLVIFGGVDTTGSLISSVLEWLTRNPEEHARLRKDPSLLRPATEEFLRYFSPVPGLARTATKQCTVGGQEVQAGERLFMSWSSANYDEAVFDNPDEVDIERSPNRHQSFGLGIHRCLGSNFARAEFRIVMEEVLRRIPEFTIDESAVPYGSIGVVNGWVSLPAKFAPGPREGTGELL